MIFDAKKMFSSYDDKTFVFLEQDFFSLHQVFLKYFLIYFFNCKHIFITAMFFLTARFLFLLKKKTTIPRAKKKKPCGKKKKCFVCIKKKTLSWHKKTFL